MKDQPITTTAAVDACRPVKNNLSEPGHSPLPWSVSENGKGVCAGSYVLLHHWDGSGQKSTIQENAKLICLAVNSHAALVAALEQARAILLRVAGGETITIVTSGKAYNDATEALKLARGEG